MPHSFGYRARTRQMFAKSFRKSGEPALAKYMITYRVGDIVDIKCDGSIHRGMPHRYYQGRTGVVYNVTQTAVGVELMKAVKHRLIRKRVNLRIEHVTPSRSREGFLNRVKANDLASKIAKEGGARAETRRESTQPKVGYTFKVEAEPVTLRPIKFDYNI
jgi:large subunit ribosomal protein L21e